MLFYDSFADDFEAKVNMYDTEKRVRIVFNRLLPDDIKGMKLLDAGCGLGFFSEEACKRGADVTSLDVGDRLLEHTGHRCSSNLVKGSIMEMPFPDSSFDIVVSSEVIEHTTDPRAGLVEIFRVLKPGGILALTVPNRAWHFSVVIANALKLRPYEGYENWVGYGTLRSWLREIGFDVEEQFGFHLIPFVSPMLYGIIDYFDRFGKSLGHVMINIAVKAVKPDGEMKEPA